MPGAGIGGERAQRDDVVEHVEAAAVGGDHQVVAVDRRCRAPRSRAGLGCSGCQWSPSSNDTNSAALGAGVQQAAAHRVLAHDVDRVGTARVGQAVGDRLPGPAAVVRAQMYGRWSSSRWRSIAA